MPDSRPASQARGPGLYGQIAATLGILILAFTIFNAALVMALYAADRSQLARDMVRIEAARVVRDLDGGALPRRPAGASEWRWTVLAVDGNPVHSGGDAGPGLSGVEVGAESTSYRETAQGVRFGGVTKVETPQGSRWVGIAVSADSEAVFNRAIFAELLEHVALPVAPLAALLLVFGLWQVRRLTRPLSRAAAEVDALDPAMLSSRLSEPASPEEVRVLVQAMNRALARIEADTRLVREFNANAAHELRTPLAIMRLAIDRLPPSPAADQLRGDVANMSRIVSQMLELAQADAMAMHQTAPVDLRALCEDLVARMAPLAWGAHRDLEVDVQGQPVVHGHGEAIARALRNLVENAVRHAPEGSMITVTVGPGATIRVRDRGAGVDPGESQLVFERFWRGQREHSDGAGLGLGIVQATMAAHGGEASVTNASDGGAVFLLDFSPAEAAPRSRPELDVALSSQGARADPA